MFCQKVYSAIKQRFFIVTLWYLAFGMYFQRKMSVWDSAQCSKEGTKVVFQECYFDTYIQGGLQNGGNTGF